MFAAPELGKPIARPSGAISEARKESGRASSGVIDR